MPLRQWGGCPFLYARYISNRLSFASASGLLQHSQGQKGIESGQKVAKVNFSLVCFGVFSGILETKNGKSEIYFGFGAFVVLLSSSFVVAVVVSTECRWSAPAPSLWACSVPFSLPLPSFLLCLWCIAFEYGFISRFKGVLARFGVRMYVCMG